MAMLAGLRSWKAESQRPPLAKYPPAAFHSPSRVFPTAGRVGVTCSSPVGSLGSTLSMLSANQEFLVSSAPRSSAHKKNLNEIALEGHLKAMESIDSDTKQFYDFIEKISKEHDENENKILTRGLEMHPAYALQGGPPSTIGVPTAVSLQPSPKTLFTPAPDAAAASGTGALFSTALAGGNSLAFTSPTAAPSISSNAFAILASVGDANNKTLLALAMLLQLWLRWAMRTRSRRLFPLPQPLQLPRFPLEALVTSFQPLVELEGKRFGGRCEKEAAGLPLFSSSRGGPCW